MTCNKSNNKSTLLCVFSLKENVQKGKTIETTKRSNGCQGLGWGEG